MVPARERMRALERLDGVPVPQERKDMDYSSSLSDAKQEVGELHLQQRAEALPVHHDAPRNEPAAPESHSAGVAGPSGFELELKLLVDADRLADFNDAPVI